MILLNYMLYISYFGSGFQFELDETAETWNRHNIRTSGNNSVPFGRPDVMLQSSGKHKISYIMFKIQKLIFVLKEHCFVL